jgi:hypothetical protein
VWSKAPVESLDQLVRSTTNFGHKLETKEPLVSADFVAKVIDGFRER